MYRVCTGQRASADVVAELVKLFEDQFAAYQAEPGSAIALAAAGPRFDDEHGANFDVPRLAAWTIVDNLLLNLDETVTKN